MKDRASERIVVISPSGTMESILFDLSKTGLCCFCAEKLDAGVVVSIRINALLIKARIVYSQDRTDGFRVGMQFFEVGAEQQKILNDMVERFSRGVPLSCAVEG